MGQVYLESGSLEKKLMNDLRRSGFAVVCSQADVWFVPCCMFCDVFLSHGYEKNDVERFVVAWCDVVEGRTLSHTAFSR